MLRLVSAISAIALCVTPALAATPTQAQGSAMTAKPAMNASPSKPNAPAATVAQKNPARSSEKPPVKTARADEDTHAGASQHRKRLAMNRSSQIGHREVIALNALELHGYTSFRDLKPEGKMISAVADKNGTEVQLKITADGQIRPSA